MPNNIKDQVLELGTRIANLGEGKMVKRVRRTVVVSDPFPRFLE